MAVRISSFLPRRLQRAAQKILRRHAARGPVGRRQLQLSPEGDRDRRHAGCDIVPAEAAADGAPVADLPVADPPRRVAERPQGTAEPLVAGDLHIAGHRPDADPAPADLDAGKPGNRLQVDQAARAHQPRLDRLHEALAAGDEHRVPFLIAAEGGERVGDRRRPHILVDGRWIHAGCSPRVAARRWRCVIARPSLGSIIGVGAAAVHG